MPTTRRQLKRKAGEDDLSDDGLKSKPPPRKRARAGPPNSASSFITLKLSPGLLAQFGQSKTQKDHELQRLANAEESKKALFPPEVPKVPDQQPAETSSTPASPSLPTAANATNQDHQPDMDTRRAWDKNLANPNRIGQPADNGSEADHQTTTTTGGNRKRKQPDRYDSVLDVPQPRAVKRQRNTRDTHTPAVPSPPPDTVATNSTSDDVDTPSSPKSLSHSDKENEATTMERPKLNLKLSFAKQNDGFVKPAAPSTASSPPAQTPTIKLKVNNQNNRDGSAKKRKRADTNQGEASVPTPASAVPKIKIKAFGQNPAQSPVTPGVKLHTRGKMPKRPPGVGYDSELSDTERDPVILESFVLRMQPGKDCDYIKDHISKGTLGSNKLHGGADIGINVFDDRGRRCCLRIRQTKYAATLVDLPTVSEGMKSWDTRRFIKSTDVCQMMIVLGPIQREEDAKSYPLPAAVDPKSYRYAHGLTAPMQWVRKRRFERTKRTRVDEIESVDRRVGQLLHNDAAYQDVEFELLDHDPRLDEDQYSGTESGEDEDAEGEDDDYFGQNGLADAEDQVDVHEPDEAELNEFDQLFAGDDEDMDEEPKMTETGQALNGAADSSGFVTSNADSPDVTGSLAPTAAPTPGGDVSTPAAPTPGSDSEDDSDDEADGEDREAKNEHDEEESQKRERIAYLEGKVAEHYGMLKTQQNQIIRRRIAQKIKDWEQEIDMLKRSLEKRKDGDEDDE